MEIHCGKFVEALNNVSNVVFLKPVASFGIKQPLVWLKLPACGMWENVCHTKGIACQRLGQVRSFTVWQLL